jgi:hypothetical protein
MLLFARSTPRVFARISAGAARLSRHGEPIVRAAAPFYISWWIVAAALQRHGDQLPPGESIKGSCRASDGLARLAGSDVRVRATR